MDWQKALVYASGVAEKLAGLAKHSALAFAACSFSEKRSATLLVLAWASGVPDVEHSHLARIPDPTA